MMEILLIVKKMKMEILLLVKKMKMNIFFVKRFWRLKNKRWVLWSRWEIFWLLLEVMTKTKTLVLSSLNWQGGGFLMFMLIWKVKNLCLQYARTIFKSAAGGQKGLCWEGSRFSTYPSCTHSNHRLLLLFTKPSEAAVTMRKARSSSLWKMLANYHCDTVSLF